MSEQRQTSSHPSILKLMGMRAVVVAREMSFFAQLRHRVRMSAVFIELLLANPRKR